MKTSAKPMIHVIERSETLSTMKTRSCILLGIFILIILISVLRETGIVELNFYKSSASSSTNSKWDSQSRIDRIGNSKEMIESIPVVLEYKSIKRGDINYPKVVTIYISHADFGTIWTPLLKVSDFKISASCHDTFVLKPTKLTNGNISLNGDIGFSGHIKIVGFCSYREAKKLILEQAMDAMYKNAKEYIKGLQLR